MPRPIVRLRVKQAFIAVASDSHDHGFTTIPVGSTIQSADDFVIPGLRPVTFDGQDLLAFTKDIRECTERIDAGSARVAQHWLRGS
jgi:hypothetical protein